MNIKRIYVSLVALATLPLMIYYWSMIDKLIRYLFPTTFSEVGGFYLTVAFVLTIIIISYIIPRGYGRGNNDKN